jgi:hypothetical protein
MWGLENLTDAKWVVPPTSHEMFDVETGKSAILTDGMTIHFGQKEGQVRS